jgi:hypothetical protein
MLFGSWSKRSVAWFLQYIVVAEIRNKEDKEITRSAISDCFGEYTINHIEETEPPKSLINEAPFVIFLLNLPPNSHLRGRLSIENHVILVPLDKPENEDDRRKLK